MSYLRSNRNKILMAVYVLILLLTLTLVMKYGTADEAERQKIGFIMTDSSTGDGAPAYEGVRAACSALGVDLLLRDNVAEFDGSCPEAVSDLVDSGAEMIILSGAGYSQEMEPLYSEYPAVTFYGIFASSASFEVPNLTSYSTRMYQARYLCGIIAGMYSSTGEIGFVATERTSEVCRNINAFALGVRRANPEAEVLVSWVGAGGSAEDAARSLISGGSVDVITYHQNIHTVIDVAEEAGVASIGYYDRIDGVSDRCLTSAAVDWTLLYEHLIREYLRGQSGDVVNDWLDLESGAVGLTEYSPLVSDSAAAEVEKARAEILSGFDVFTNVIYDNEGNLRCGEGESMTDETLLRNMDWLVEGVRVYE